MPRNETTVNSLQGVTDETLAAIAKAQTSGITVDTGIMSYDLSGLISLVPVHTPMIDVTPVETSTDGNKFAVWRAIMDTTSNQPDPSMGFDYAAALAVISEQDFQVPYMPRGLSGSVTQDAYDLGRGYADAYATSTFHTLNQVLIGQDRKLIGAQAFALATAAAPSLTQKSTGGTITNVQVYVAAAGRTGSGYYYGTGNSRATAGNTTFASGSANSIVATVTAQRGAVCYDWFQSADGTTWWYYTTTTTNTATMTKIITANQTLPTTLPQLSTSWKGSANTVPTVSTAADNGSANAKDDNGLIASLAGDYTSTGQWATPGSATTNPSVFRSLDGAALTLDGGSIAEIENYLFLPLWNQVFCSPTAVMVNAAEAQKIANLVLGSTSATTFLQTDSSGRIDVSAGGRVGHIINAPAGGVKVPIEVHTSLPPGSIIARTDRVPFPQAQIANVISYRNLRYMSQFDYAAARVANTAGGGPRREYEIRSVGAFVNRAPVAMGRLANIG
jgi:hypothetical protein